MFIPRTRYKALEVLRTYYNYKEHEPKFKRMKLKQLQAIIINTWLRRQ